LGGDTGDFAQGYVIAHELVHLLQGDRTQHAENGIMRARWTAADSETFLWNARLTPSDTELVRLGFSQRLGQRTQRLASVASGRE